MFFLVLTYLKTFGNSRLFLYLLSLISLLSFLSAWAYLQQDRYQQAADSATATAGIHSFINELETDPRAADYQEKRALLVKEEQLLNRLYSYVFLDNYDNFSETASQLRENELALLAYYPEGLSFLPPLHQIEAELTLHNYLKAQSFILNFNQHGLGQGIALLLPLLTMATLSFTIMTSSFLAFQEESHPSIIKSLPYSLNQRLLAHLVTISSLTLAFFFLTLSLYALFLAIPLGFNNHLTVIPLYTTNGFQVVPLIFYLLLLLLYLLLLVSLISLLTLILVPLTRSLFITISSLFLIFLSGHWQMAPLLLERSWFYYLAPLSLLQGSLAEITKQEHLTVTKGLLILTVWITCLTLLLSSLSYVKNPSFLTNFSRKGAENP
ncbi:hypothetical protein [Vagococcus salmoninarum]|uniref:hypothetical protein n=1 Tax=Vagococcus salmoninarum TaxID=2739 RepID=UPI003F996A7F